jgi:hypothetical protein
LTAQTNTCTDPSLINVSMPHQSFAFRDRACERLFGPKPSCSPVSAACWRISEHVQMVEALLSSAEDACSGLMNGIWMD